MTGAEEINRLKDRILRSRRQEHMEIPAFVSGAVAVEKDKIRGRQVYRLIPERATGNIFYLYHSDYVRDITRKQWEFILQLCTMTRMAVTVPLYPLAPEQDCEEVFDHLIPAYQSFCKHREKGPLIMIGAGNGGGFVVSLMLQIWKEGLADPDKVVLLSPIMDAEFFDQKMEEKVIRTMGKERFDLRKEFLDRYWVKNYAGRMEYTAPIYEDLHDICKDILVASGSKDPFSEYAREFSSRVQDTGNPLKFFEYREAGSDFYLHGSRKDTKHLMRMLHDFLLDSEDAILYQYMEEVRQRAEWSKWFPEIFTDERATRYVSGHPMRATKEGKAKNIYSLMGAAVQRSYDEAVSLFLKEYPNGTVVYIGCSMDTMLERVDNGRVLWYNLDSPGRIAVRTMYTGLGGREKRIERSVHDDSWVSELVCEKDRGLLFVVKDIFSYMKWKEMKSFLDLLYRNFQGCNVLFDVPTPRANLMYNMKGRSRGAEYRRRRLAMRDPRREIESMSPIYAVITVRSVLENVKMKRDWKFGLKWSFWSNRNREAWKIVHIRLGFEKYRTFDELGSGFRKSS